MNAGVISEDLRCGEWTGGGRERWLWIRGGEETGLIRCQQYKHKHSLSARRQPTEQRRGVSLQPQPASLSKTLRQTPLLSNNVLLQYYAFHFRLLIGNPIMSIQVIRSLYFQFLTSKALIYLSPNFKQKIDCNQIKNNYYNTAYQYRVSIQ